MFWALFGLGNTDDGKFESVQNEKYESALLTEILCFFLYGLYRVATVIFLLNMLIASMTQSYERIFVFIL